MRNWLWIIRHQICDAARIFGIRDRLRCPECKSVGTWKPHGGWFDNSKASGRRWLCKWCGHYVGMLNGEIIERDAFIDFNLKCWRIWDNYDNIEVPQNVYIPRDDAKSDPWVG